MPCDCGKMSGEAKQFLAAFSACLAVMASGCVFSWPSPALPKLEQNHTDVVATEEELSWIVSSCDMGNIVSPLLAAYVNDILGRKFVILISGGLFLLSWIFTWYATSPWWLYLARFVGGFSNGVTFTVVPIYLAEISSTNVRGALTTMFNAFFGLGTLFEVVIGPYVSFTTLAVLSGLILLPFFFSFPFMPDSPQFLLMKGRDKDARRSLLWLRSVSIDDYQEIEQELGEMKTFAKESIDNKGSFYDLVKDSNNRRALLIVLVLSAAQRLVGLSAIINYSSSSLPQNEGLIGPNEIIVLFGAIFFMTNILVVRLVDNLGRKPLLMVSSLGTSVTTVICTVVYYLYIEDKVRNEFITWILYISVLLFSVFENIGLGTIPFTLLSELFPANLRSKASSLAAITISVCTLLVNKMYITVNTHFGVFTNYGFYTVCGFLSAIFIYFYVFETKNKSFTEIQQILRREVAGYPKNSEIHRLNGVETVMS